MERFYAENIILPICVKEKVTRSSERIQGLSDFCLIHNSSLYYIFCSIEEEKKENFNFSEKLLL